MSWSSPAATVTVCAVDQSPVVNVRLAGCAVTVPSPPSAVTVSVTVSDGWADSRALNDPEPSSATVSETGSTTMPGLSLSRIVPVAEPCAMTAPSGLDSCTVSVSSSSRISSGSSSTLIRASVAPAGIVKAPLPLV